jgi:hypothetical protein
MIEFKAAYQDWMDRVAVLAFYRDGASRMSRVGQPLEIVMAEHKDGAYIDRPTLDLKAAEATSLMNALWSAGVRPTDFKNPDGEINRMEAHLSDLRKLIPALRS